MKELVLIMALILGSFQASAQTQDSKKYNLLTASIDQKALNAKLGMVMYAGLVFDQLAKNTQQGHQLNDTKVCFRLGSFLAATLESSVGYEIHAVNPEQKANGLTTTKLALRAATFCGLSTDEIVNPEYAKVAAGLQSTSEIGTISTVEELREVVQQIVALSAVN